MTQIQLYKGTQFLIKRAFDLQDFMSNNSAAIQNGLIGAGRFRFAPQGQRFISLGSTMPGAINHPKDVGFNKGDVPNKYHFEVTPEMLEKISTIKAAEVIGHIAGPSGSGKTTLLNKAKTLYPHLTVSDLDDFDNQAEINLKYDKIRKNDYTDVMLEKLFNERQLLLDQFIAKNNANPILFAGHHTEAGHILNIPTANRYLLPTSPRVSAMRAFEREKGHHPGHERELSEIPDDIKINKETVNELLGLGYVKTKPNQILSKLKRI